jgi:hypothetical protein
VLRARKSAESRRVSISESRDSQAGFFAMEDLRKRFDEMTDLAPFPKIATLIGNYTAQFARFELSIWSAYAVVLGMEEDEVMVLIGDIQSFATKLTGVERFLLEKRNQINFNLSIRKIFQSARQINTFRNKLVHGLYLTYKKRTAVYLLAFGTDPNRQIPMSVLIKSDQTNFFELTEPLLQSELAKISGNMNELLRMMMALKPKSILRT